MIVHRVDRISRIPRKHWKGEAFFIANSEAQSWADTMTEYDHCKRRVTRINGYEALQLLNAYIYDAEYPRGPVV